MTLYNLVGDGLRDAFDPKMKLPISLIVAMGQANGFGYFRNSGTISLLNIWSRLWRCRTR